MVGRYEMFLHLSMHPFGDLEIGLQYVEFTEHVAVPFDLATQVVSFGHAADSVSVVDSDIKIGHIICSFVQDRSMRNCWSVPASGFLEDDITIPSDDLHGREYVPNCGKVWH